MIAKSLPLVLLTGLVACKGYSATPYTEPLKLADGKTVPAATLNAGRDAYMHYCRTCHGDKGDGHGPAAAGLRPPPRNFTRGVFKFGAVAAPALPSDDDLFRIVRGGLHGTAMLQWDVPDSQLREILQYIKVFSERWKEEEPGEKIATPEDPWKGKVDAAIAEGKKQYHGYAQCAGCHPAYGSKQEVFDALKAVAKELKIDAPAAPSFRDEMYDPSPTESSDFSVDSDRPLKILPPDFLRHEVRSIRTDNQLADLYRVIASGVGGTAMPSWKASGLADDKIWALAHYVKSLMDMKGTPAGAELIKRNRLADASWAPPAEKDARK